MKTVISWNVNGIRAVSKKGFAEWLKSTSPFCLAIQETKAQVDQLDSDIREIDGYSSYFISAERKGYSGVAIYSKEEPLAIENLGVEEFDKEGRTIVAKFPEFTVVNCYFPNSQEAGARLDYKLDFCKAIKKRCDELADSGENVILCGDYNIAHKAIDLANPTRNEKNPGYLPEEREWMSEFLHSGWRDLFREQHPGEEGHYSWWSYRFQARVKNIGWRIDYLCVNGEFSLEIGKAKILSEVMGSDHCPVSLDIGC